MHSQCIAQKYESIVLVVLEAQNSTQPLNMFSYMQTEGIGVQQAALYVAWSGALEMQGDLQQADIIFLEGLKCGARPLDELQRHYR